jgi:hypothetical protein
VSTHNSKNYVGFPPHKWLVHMAIFHPCSRCRPRRPHRPVPATKYTHTHKHINTHTHTYTHINT